MWIAGIIIASGIALWPLFKSGFYISDDGEWMVIRLTAFYQSLASGQFPVRLLGRLNHSYGYPVANFLYPGFLYIGSALHLVGFSFVDAVKTILAVSVLGSSIVAFYALRKSYTPRDSFIGALSLMFAPYLLYDLYVRGSVGEVLSLLPALGLMFVVSTGALWLMPPLIAFLIVSHNSMALLFAAVFSVLFTLRFGIRRIIPHAVIGVGMASFFWVPALVERALVRFDTVRISDPENYFITPETGILLSVPTLLSIAMLLGRRKRKSANIFVVCFFVIVSTFLALPVSAPLWPGTLTSFVQFPYRFLMVSVVLSPWLIAHAFERLQLKRALFLGSLFVIFWLYSTFSIQSTIRFVDRDIGYYTTNEGTTTVADEYMPYWVSKTPLERTAEAIQVIDGDVNLESRRFPKEAIVTTFDAKTTGIIQINKIYYPGWRVAIDGSPVDVDYRGNPFGFMQIQVSQGKHHIKAAFRETPFRFVMDAISLISFMLYVLFVRKLQRA